MARGVGCAAAEGVGLRSGAVAALLLADHI